MIKLVINFFILIFLISCQKQDMQNISEVVEVKKNLIKKLVNKKKIDVSASINDTSLKYVLGDQYFINGVKYIPEENYNYNEIGLASFYNKELHNKKTINNDIIKLLNY